MSGGERPDLAALQELASVLQHVESELAGWRRRALTAEQRLAETEPGAAAPPAAAGQLEEENRELVRRLDAAKVRVADLLDRLRFLEQQRENGGTER